MSFDRTKEIFGLIIDWKKTVISIVIPITILITIYAILLPNKYTAEATLLPSGEGGGPLGLISGMVPGILEQLTQQSTGISSFLFPDILKSRRVILAVAKETFDSTTKSICDGNNLQQYYNWKNEYDIYDNFMRKAKMSYSLEKGIINISFTSKKPYLSFWVVNQWLDKLEWYLQHNMQTQSKKEYDYLTVRKKETLKMLNEAEESLNVFLSTHKNYISDPIVNMQYSKLNVILEKRREIYALTIQQIETAKVNIVKSIPVVNILDPPRLPQKKSKPKRSIIVVTGFLVSWLLAFLMIYIKTSLNKNNRIE